MSSIPATYGEILQRGTFSWAHPANSPAAARECSASAPVFGRRLLQQPKRMILSSQDWDNNPILMAFTCFFTSYHVKPPEIGTAPDPEIQRLDRSTRDSKHQPWEVSMLAFSMTRNGERKVKKKKLMGRKLMIGQWFTVLYHHRKKKKKWKGHQSLKNRPTMGQTTRGRS